MRPRHRPGIVVGITLEIDVVVHGGEKKVNDINVFGVFLLHYVFALRGVGRLALVREVETARRLRCPLDKAQLCNPFLCNTFRQGTTWQWSIRASSLYSPIRH